MPDLYHALRYIVPPRAPAALRERMRERMDHWLRHPWLALERRYGETTWGVTGGGATPSAALCSTDAWQAQSRSPVAPQLIVRQQQAPADPHAVRGDREARGFALPRLQAGLSLDFVVEDWFHYPRSGAPGQLPELLEPILRLERDGGAQAWRMTLRALLWHEDGMLFGIDAVELGPETLQLDAIRQRAALEPIYDPRALDNGAALSDRR